MTILCCATAGRAGFCRKKSTVGQLAFMVIVYCLIKCNLKAGMNADEPLPQYEHDEDDDGNGKQSESLLGRMPAAIYPGTTGCFSRWNKTVTMPAMSMMTARS